MKFTKKELLYNKIDIKGDNDCRNFLGSKDKNGYGKINIGGFGLAHRLSYFLDRGDIDDKLLVRHLCNNPSCCNPKHLEQGTHKDNANDMVISKRTSGEYLELDGIIDTISGHCTRYGFSKECIRFRMRRLGLSLKESLTKPTQEIIKIGDIEDTIYGHAKRKGISMSTVWHRIHKSGYTIDDAINKPVFKAKKYLYNGIYDTIRGHCIRHGKMDDFRSIKGRVNNYGFDIKDAIETPILNKNPSK